MADSVPRKRRKPLDEATERSHREVIVGMYEMLQDAFSNYLPELSDQLRPALAGWVYDPTWPGPRPPGEYTDYKSDLPRIPQGREPKPKIDADRGLRIGASTFLLALRSSSREFREVEDRIFRRFWAQGVQFRSPDILNHAITAARLTLDAERRAYKFELVDFENRDIPQNRISIEVHKHFERRELISRRIRLLKVRVFWLQQWRDFDRRRALRLAIERVTRIQPANYTRLIKPSELRSVHSILDDVCSDSSKVEAHDIIDPEALVQRINSGQETIDRILQRRLPQFNNSPAGHDFAEHSADDLTRRLAWAMTCHVVGGPLLYEFLSNDPKISKATHNLGLSQPDGPNKQRLNRMLLDDLLPGIMRNSTREHEQDRLEILQLLSHWYCKMLWQCGADSKARRKLRLKKAQSGPKYDTWLNKVRRKLREPDPYIDNPDVS